MSDETNKPVAKSLHTIKVIQQVAAAFGPESDKPAAVANAMKILGLSGRPDPYGLEEKAIRLWK